MLLRSATISITFPAGSLKHLPTCGVQHRLAFRRKQNPREHPYAGCVCHAAQAIDGSAEKERTRQKPSSKDWAAAALSCSVGTWICNKPVLPRSGDGENAFWCRMMKSKVSVKPSDWKPLSK